MMKTLFLMMGLLISQAALPCDQPNQYFIMIHGIGGTAGTFGDMKETIEARVECSEGRYFEYDTGDSTLDVPKFAEELGYRIKHLGIARRSESGVELRVHPTLIPEKRLIANVDGVMNAVLVKSDAVGPTLYYGPGAGAEPTASAVVA